ncbi:MAG TPA: hypothetical protein VFU98_04010 [Microlunatus sp.]|nr:hypothetical protein [Microlunatus sp.]
MAKRKNTSHGRSGDPRKRAAEEQRQAEASPALEDEVAAALELGHPIDIVMLASSLITSVEPELQRLDAAELPPVGEFVRMFVDSGEPDLMIFAWVVAQLLPDVQLQVAVDRAVSADLLPDWVRAIRDAVVAPAWQTTDPLRDSTDIVVPLRIGDDDLSLIGLVDFNTDGALKDAFAVPVPLAAVQEALSASGQTGMDSRDLDPADARAWLTDAIATGRTLEPPFETDTWPQIRPLLEWALALCPPGGRGWERRRWTVEEISGVVADFAASPEAAGVVDRDDLGVLTSALEVLGEETYGDPLLLGAVKLEMGLSYLWATRLHFDLEPLLDLPEVLGPYVRWAHAQRGIPADDTDEALAMIAHRRAEYVRDVTQVLGDEDG